MFLALTTLTIRPLTQLQPASEPPARRPGIALAPTLCFEVLVPYLDPQESLEKGMPADTRHSLIVKVWATDVEHATACARERFRDYRFRHRTARMTVEGPVPLRVVRPEPSQGDAI